MVPACLQGLVGVKVTEKSNYLSITMVSACLQGLVSVKVTKKASYLFIPMVPIYKALLE